MTVVVWDGKTLAADKRMTYYGLITPVTKIYRAGDSLLGFSGTAGNIGRYRAWFEGGADPTAFPAQDGDNAVRMLAIRPGGRIEMYDRSGYPMVIEGRTCVIGSGQDYAAAALYLGCNAVGAVHVACALNSDCGEGVDTLTLDPEVHDGTSEILADMAFMGGKGHLSAMGGCNCFMKAPTIPTCRSPETHLDDCPAKGSGYRVGVFRAANVSASPAGAVIHNGPAVGRM